MLNQISGGVYLTFLNILITVFWVYTCLSFGLSRSIFLFSILFLSLLYEIILNLSIQFIVFLVFLDIFLSNLIIFCVLFLLHIFYTQYYIFQTGISCDFRTFMPEIFCFLPQKDRQFRFAKTNLSFGKSILFLQIRLNFYIFEVFTRYATR